MSGYEKVAVLAAEKAQRGIEPRHAWKTSAHEIYPDDHQKPSREKVCPRCAFLGLAEDGLILGVPQGKYTASILNKQYAVAAVGLLQHNPDLASDPEILWLLVMNGEKKKHNEQMNVVTSLWNMGFIQSGS